jgi:hypothetical protein
MDPSVCCRIIEVHGGTTRVETAEGGVAALVMALPPTAPWWQAVGEERAEPRLRRAERRERWEKALYLHIDGSDLFLLL